MDVDAAMAPSTMTTHQHVRLGLADARLWLAAAHDALGLSLPEVAPRERMQRAVDAARRAADHLYGVGRLDAPGDAVRAAVDAAESTMVVVRRLEYPRPAAVDVRAVAAGQLEHVDGALARLELAICSPVAARA